MRIVLIGFMCSGKTTVSKLLAERLGVPAVEMDELIIEQSGCAGIAEIFEKHGEPYFRQLESEVSGACAQLNDVVISTGGGIIGRPENIARLRSGNSRIVYLQTSFETIYRRQELEGGWDARPLFKSPEAAKNLYLERTLAYEEASDVSVTTDGRTPAEVAAEIVSYARSALSQ